MTIRALMLPQPNPSKPGTSGIARVVEAYYRHLPDYGIELVHPDADGYDLLALHISDNHGLIDERPMVLHNHGLHWTADYVCQSWQYKVNASVVHALRHASKVTVPSAWVAETFQRDLRFTPHVIPHGIDWQDWQSDAPQGDYVLWNKNRSQDVCDAMPVSGLARAFPRQHFVTTFLPPKMPPTNQTNVIGLVPYDQMKRLVQSAAVYLSTTKETFGIGVLEAMASGVPVLGYAHGGNVALVEHGINGYLAKPGDIDDLAEGLIYCLKHRNTLGENGREMARRWTWDGVCEQVADVYRLALKDKPPTVGVVIPVYNKSEAQLRRVIESVINQDYDQLVVIDDGSDRSGDQERNRSVVGAFTERDARIRYIAQGNSGVATARNNGIFQCDTKYIVCLDADDAIRPEFIETCVRELEADRSLGIAYTGLWAITPDGEESLSPWPGEWDYDASLKRQAQIPTCCVFRREMWEKLGGYRQRYAPSGAGEEDAEFWLRSGAYGWKAKKVTDEGLFVYSWQSGIVSGNPDHRVSDYTAWHPWVKDGRHPLASCATPRNDLSHPVRQYDEPVVSVVIPVGPGHEKDVINALDSLEAQTFRKWEVIVVNDTGSDDNSKILMETLKAYPYVRTPSFYVEEGFDTWNFGAGASRNRGAEIARAPFLLFLDADDWLYPSTLNQMVEAWNEYQSIIYTDYVGKATPSPEYLEQLERENRLYFYNKRTGEAVIGSGSDTKTWMDFDCELAQRQPEPTGDPNMPYYHWCLITALIPRTWHNAINGFDESMPSWEDVDYHWRLAKAGYCYHRIPQELMVYNFHTGHRREHGRQIHESLLEYLYQKHEGIESMPCSGCGGNRRRSQRANSALVSRTTAQSQAVQEQVDDTNFVECKYVKPNRGQHQVTGAAVFNQPIPGWRMVRRGLEAWSIDYGYRAGGGKEKFLVHREDMKLHPHWFTEVVAEQVVDVPEERVIVAPPEPLVETVDVLAPVPDGKRDIRSLIEDHDTWSLPAGMDADEMVDMAAGVINERSLVDDIISPPPDITFDLQKIPGVSSNLAKQLEADDIADREALLALGADGLKRYKGVGERKAELIIAFLQESK